MEQIENQTDFYRWKHGLLFNQSEIELFASSGSSPEEKEFRAGFLVGLYKQGISYKDMTGDSKMKTEISLSDAFSRLHKALEELQNEKCHLCRFNTVGQDEYIHALEDQEKEKDTIIQNMTELLIRAMALIDGSQGNMQKAWLDDVTKLLRDN